MDNSVKEESPKKMMAKMLAKCLYNDLISEFGTLIDLPTEDQICRDLEEPQEVD